MNGITFPKNSATSNPRAVKFQTQLGSERSSSLNAERAEPQKEVRLEAGGAGRCREHGGKTLDHGHKS